MVLKSLIDYSGEGQIVLCNEHQLKHIMTDQITKVKIPFSEAVKHPSFQPIGIIQVLASRLQGMNVEITDMLGFTIIESCENPAQAVMWAFTLYRIAQENKEVRMLDCELVFMRYFPEGVPSQASMNALWTECKDESNNNRMDNFSNWS